MPWRDCRSAGHGGEGQRGLVITRLLEGIELDLDGVRCVAVDVHNNLETWQKRSGRPWGPADDPRPELAGDRILLPVPRALADSSLPRGPV